MNTEKIRRQAETIEEPERTAALASIDAAESHLKMAQTWIETSETRVRVRAEIEARQAAKAAEEEAALADG